MFTTFDKVNEQTRMNSMLTVYDQAFILNKIKGIKIFRPEMISILFIKSGSIELSISGNKVEITSPSVFFVSPGYSGAY